MTFFSRARRPLAFFLILFGQAMWFQPAGATHAAGMELGYRCLGGLQYEVSLVFYRDCAGAAAPSQALITVSATSIGYSAVLTASQAPGSGQEITLPCATAASTCTGGPMTGIRRYVYRDTVTLTAACPDWTFGYSECCRNCAITTIQNPCSDKLFVRATLDNVSAPGNSAPRLTGMPLLFACTGQPFHYNPGAVDYDGDSLVFALVAPMTGPASTVSYLPSATPSAPLLNTTVFNFDPATGEIVFIPTMAQVGVLAVAVKEYRAGLLIGTTMRDIQVYVQACDNLLPKVSGINGTGKYSMTACPGQQVCFNLYGMDADSGQSVTLTHHNDIAGAVYTITPGPVPVLQFCWTPDSSDVSEFPESFVVEATDDACPMNGTQAFTFRIFISRPEVSVVSSDASCAGLANGTATAVASGNGGMNYSWNTNPIQYGAQAAGLGEGTYTVTVTDVFGCSRSAGIEINEPSEMQVTSMITEVSCHGAGTGAIDVLATGGTPGYTFSWSTGATSSGIQNLTSGPYLVTVTDSHSCKTLHYAFIGQPPMIDIETSITNAACHGTPTGGIHLSVTGGILPHSYQWNTGATSKDLSFIPSGSYAVTVTDAHGCTTHSSTIVKQPATLAAQALVSDALGGFCDGEIEAVGLGGIPPYNWSWAGGAQTPVIDSLCPGMYTVSVTDDKGCMATDSFEVKLAGPSGGTSPPDPKAFQVINPVNGKTIVSFVPEASGPASVSLYDMRGRWVDQLFTRTVQRGQKYRFPVTLNRAAGSYIMVLNLPGQRHAATLLVLPDR